MTAAAIIEFLHALFIALLIIMVPFLFIGKWKWLQITSAAYCAVFIAVNRLSQWLWGECIWTKIARHLGGVWDGQLFIVKCSKAIFNFIPSLKQISYLEHGMVLIVCLGILYSVLKTRK